MTLVVVAMLGVPLTIGHTLVTDHQHSQAADTGVAGVDEPPPPADLRCAGDPDAG
jgi:hypothetical protein